MKNYVVGIGGANIDISARLLCAAKAKDSNPSHIAFSCGGVARNVLENLSRLGENCVLLSSVGDDDFGKSVLKSCRECGIDESCMLLSQEYPTGSYLAMLGQDADLLISSCDARIIENIPIEYFEKNKELMQGAAAVFIDPNLTEKQLDTICNLAGNAKIFVDTVSTAKAERVRGILDRIWLLKPNLLELEVLCGTKVSCDEDIKRAAFCLLDKGLFSICVSLGARGSYYADRDGEEFFCFSKRVENMENATGAGDAFMAGYIKSSLLSMSKKDRVEYASACGRMAVLSKESVNKNVSHEAVLENMNVREQI